MSSTRPLSSKAAECPRCGTLNEPVAAACSRCNLRLARPTAGLAPLSGSSDAGPDTAANDSLLGHDSGLHAPVPELSDIAMLPGDPWPRARAAAATAPAGVQSGPAASRQPSPIGPSSPAQVPPSVQGWAGDDPAARGGRVWSAAQLGAAFAAGAVLAAALALWLAGEDEPGPSAVDRTPPAIAVEAPPTRPDGDGPGAATAAAVPAVSASASPAPADRTVDCQPALAALALCPPSPGGNR